MIQSFQEIQHQMICRSNDQKNVFRIKKIVNYNYKESNAFLIFANWRQQIIKVLHQSKQKKTHYRHLAHKNKKSFKIYLRLVLRLIWSIKLFFWFTKMCMKNIFISFEF